MTATVVACVLSALPWAAADTPHQSFVATPTLDRATGAERPAVGRYTIPEGAAGFYAIADSSLRRDEAQPGQIEVRVQVERRNTPAAQQPAPVVVASLEAGEPFDFDAFLGYLNAGDAVQVAIGAAGDPTGDRTAVEFKVARAPEIPVTVFPDDFGRADAVRSPGGWSVTEGMDAGSVAARRLAWGRGRAAGPAAHAAGYELKGGALLAAFRVPQSGYYALHDAWFAATGAAVEARAYVGDESAARWAATARAGAQRMSLPGDVGYVARGEVLYLAFTPAPSEAEAGGAGARVNFGGEVVEWAPRRAPLRVQRGSDGYLDVYEPEAPRRAVEIPAEKWIHVAAPSGDATQTLRDALARAQRRGDGYVGIRLERGKTYTVATGQVGGSVFPINDTERVVFDGNGATLHVASQEIVRRGVDLFVLARSRNVVFADLTVTAATIPWTTGEILDVSPRGENTQTVTFRVDAGALDPLRDIARDGRANAYAYDPKIPGRLALGSWTHYPGSGNPSLRATDTPGVFTHRVTRTGDSIEPGGKWLIKNKGGGVVYLVTRAGAEDITLSGIDGRAPGGGQLRFWQTSGINILDCRFEPDGDNWISSSADGVHGRGREGVWIENTVIRGICEDVMNTYGQNMVVGADDNPDDAVMTIRMFNRSAESFDDGAMPIPTPENVVAGDQLVFFNPRTGRVLGYAGVIKVERDRFTLTNPVPEIDPWEEGDGQKATMVYNTRVAGRFFVRDTRIMDSMRFGIYIKARGGVVFGSQFEGLSAPSIFATNEPEWPEGPPATHLWVQGCTFSQNNYGYMPRHRDFMVVDPADISVYTRRFRAEGEPDDHRAHLTSDQYANSHLKFIGNVFHDWRGMGISVRNAKDVTIADNLFLPPVNDDVLRRTLAQDRVLNANGRGAYAAIHLDSVGGVRVSGNRFQGLAGGDRGLVKGSDVAGLEETNNTGTGGRLASVVASASFSEWFGETSVVVDAAGREAGAMRVDAGMHRAGKLGAGLAFEGGNAARVAIAGEATAVALWVRPERVAGEQVVFAQKGVSPAVKLAIREGRWQAGVEGGAEKLVLDLGPAVGGVWQHVVLGFDAGAQTLRGFVDGVEVAMPKVGPRAISFSGEMTLGGTGERDAGESDFHGMIDEVRWLRAVPDAAELSAMALRKVE